MFNKKYRLGLRAIKTAISVMLCMIVAFFLKNSDGFFSSTATVICMQQTTDKSFDAGVHRLLGTVTGGVLGYIALVLLENFKGMQSIINIVLAPLFVLFMIYLSNTMNYKASTQIGCVVLLSLISNQERSFSDAFFHMIERILDTSMGIVIAVLVNKLVFSYKKLDPKSEPKAKD
ncbi:MAG: FUSC family protein [Oscillospiraceae bacterium]|jgi:uncharacterized membrane protein YgaE (UPF0421/DUF939 family)|nr:FUSC family protein [Oscillospiraceae bacterium]